ncbi:unnamed protein product [Lampetra planeri]
MEVASIEVRELRELLPLSSAGDADDDEEEVRVDLAPSSCLVLDCRAFLAFGAARVRGSVCVRWGALERRRSGAAGMTLERAVPCPRGEGSPAGGRRGLPRARGRGVAELRVAGRGEHRAGGGDRAAPIRAARAARLPGGGVLCLPRGLPRALPPLGRAARSARLPQHLHPPAGGHGVTPLAVPVELPPLPAAGQRPALVAARRPAHAGHIAVWFRSAIQFHRSERRRGGRVLVFCQAGVSRSATICLAYLMWRSRMRLEEAFAFLKGRRSVVSPNLGFMGQLLQFEAQLLAATPREDTGTADCGDGSDGDDASGTIPRALPGTPVAPSSPCSVFSFSPGSLPVLSPVPPVSSC